MTWFPTGKCAVFVKTALAVTLFSVLGQQSFAQTPKAPVPKKPLTAVKKTAVKPGAVSAAPAPKPAVAPRRTVYRSRKRRYYSRRRARVAAPIVLLRKTGNLVEPLSNGLTFTLPRASVQTQFGKPQKVVGSQLRYANFGVEYLKNNDRMNFVALQGDVKLNSKIGAGSKRSQVEKAFGKLDKQGDVIYKTYKLHFSPGPGGIIEAVTVSPAPGQVAF